MRSEGPAKILNIFPVVATLSSELLYCKKFATVQREETLSKKGEMQKWADYFQQHRCFPHDFNVAQNLYRLKHEIRQHLLLEQLKIKHEVAAPRTESFPPMVNGSSMTGVSTMPLAAEAATDSLVLTVVPPLDDSESILRSTGHPSLGNVDVSDDDPVNGSSVRIANTAAPAVDANSETPESPILHNFSAESDFQSVLGDADIPCTHSLLVEVLEAKDLKPFVTGKMESVYCTVGMRSSNIAE